MPNKMKGFYDNIERSTLANLAYREVVYTDVNLQLVYMTLQPLEEIGLEVHPTTTQFIRVESGFGTALIARQSYPLFPGAVVIVPPNTYHNIINTSTITLLQLYTIYSPPEHPPGTYEFNKV